MQCSHTALPCVSLRLLSTPPPVALVLLFLFGIPILLVMGMVGLGTALAAS
jgi:hypothetical protein